MRLLSEHEAYSLKIFKQDDVLISRYKIVRTLGRGTSGMVYQARDLQIGRDIALKLIFLDGPNQETAKQRIHQEIRIAYKIESDYVIKLYDCFTWGAYVGLVLEYVDGTSLFDITQSEQLLPWRDITKIGRQVAFGLHAIHQAGIIHRDIKLENILLNTDGIAKITDFGISVRESFLEGQYNEERDEARGQSRIQSRLTGDGRVVGTIHYLSPEYLETQKCDSRGDIYALGILLYELVTCQYPFEYSSIPELVKKKIEGEPRSIYEFREDCPKWLHDLVMRCMAKDPDERPPSAEAVYRALAGALANTRSPSEQRRLRLHSYLARRRRQKRIRSLIGIISLLILLAFCAYRWDLMVMAYYQLQMTITPLFLKLPL
ncbi:MAG: serine/threonine protein kinase [Bdellovibrionota bacterium]